METKFDPLHWIIVTGTLEYNAVNERFYIVDGSVEFDLIDSGEQGEKVGAVAGDYVQVMGLIAYVGGRHSGRSIVAVQTSQMALLVYPFGSQEEVLAARQKEGETK